MTSSCPHQHYTYLDAHELAELLNLSTRAILLRAKHRPWLLPPRAQLYDSELLRWRQDVVEAWQQEPDR
jgi:hypothetical protein